MKSEPNSDFFIFAINFGERVEAIGEHPNVRYILGQNPNDKEVVEYLKRKLDIQT